MAPQLGVNRFLAMGASEYGTPIRGRKGYLAMGVPGCHFDT